MLYALVIIAMSLTISSFALRSGRAILAFAGAGAWALLGISSYSESTVVWDIYYGLFWLSMGMVFACVLVATVLREKKEDSVSVEDVDEYEDKDLLDNIEASEKDRKRFEKLFGSRRRRVRRKPSRFARTGQE